MEFLGTHERRPLSIRAVSESQVKPLGYYLGKGSGGLEIVLYSSVAKPTGKALQRLWRGRLSGRAVPLLTIILYLDKAALCGPTGTEPPVYFNVDREFLDRICSAALEQPDKHTALRYLQMILPQLGSALPGVVNEGFLATHELNYGVPLREDWRKAKDFGKQVLHKRGKELLEELNYTIVPWKGALSILTAEDIKVAMALFLDQSEVVDVGSERYDGRSPIAHALNYADRERLPYVIVLRGGELRLYPVQTGVGVGQRGRTDTFIQLDLNLLSDSMAAYLWLLFSSSALEEGGSLEQILATSRDYAANLSVRLRERIYQDVIPTLSYAIADALSEDLDTREELDTVYQMALMLLFRLLFVAYGEDQGLLPYRSNERYQSRSLKKKAHDLINMQDEGIRLADGTSIWEEINRLFSAVNKGSPELGVPAYNGGLFSSDPDISEVGARLDAIKLKDQDFGNALSTLLVEETSEGPGPVDFRSLGTREFGTIYEGLLESELSLADVDLAVNQEGVYYPVDDEESFVVPAGSVYLHNASGARKSSGTYYTKSFVVDHLLDTALEPALDDHLDRLEKMDDRAAGKAFFDFRVADIAMGSGHFLVAAVDRIEKKLSNYLTERPLPFVIDEIERLRKRAVETMEQVGESIDLDDSQLLRRQVARRCIYGVDLNPIAVELARLAIWIHTFIPGLPLSLLDYNLVHGNSLVGIATLEEMQELLGTGKDADLFGHSGRELLKIAENTLSKFRTFTDADAAEIQNARSMYREIRGQLKSAEALFDILAASRLDEVVKQDLVQVWTWMGDPNTLPNSASHIRSQTVFRAIKPLHFPIAFPQVFLRERSGFDVILGNPPWEEATLEEDRFWIRYRPGLQGLNQRDQEAEKAELRERRPDLVVLFEKEKDEIEFLRRQLNSGPFPGMGTGDADLYKAFFWRFWNLVAEDSGYIGVVLPRSAFSAKGSELIRKELLNNGTVRSYVTLLNNRQWIFDSVHPQYTISLLSLLKKDPNDEAVVCFKGPFRSNKDFIENAGKAAAEFPSKEILEWTDTAAFPLLPEPESADVFAQLRKAPRLDLDEPGQWRALPYRELDATNDKKLKDGTILMHFSGDIGDSNWPVYKGASFDLWTPDTGTYYAWADPEVAIQRLQEKRERSAKLARSAMSEFTEDWILDKSTQPCYSARIAFRDVTNRTNTRTVVTALIPPEVFITNTGPFLLWPRGDEKDQAYLLGILSSISLDWYARRFVETHVNFHILNAFPIPRMDRSHTIWMRIVELSGRLASPDERFTEWAKSVGVSCVHIESEEKESMIHELDALAALAYGLEEKHLRHIFETFHDGWDYEDQLEKTMTYFKQWKKEI